MRKEDFGEKGADLLGKRSRPFGEKEQTFWGKGADFLEKRGRPFGENEQTFLIRNNKD
jgi:hypothetical protein